MRFSTDTKVLIGLGAAAGAGHVLYPAVLAMLGVVRRVPSVDVASPADGGWPDVTVVIPAFREVGTLPSKIADLRANGYPGSLEILVVSEDPETAACASDAGVRVLAPDERRGKSQAINAGIDAARTPIVVVTDANNTLTRGSLQALVAPFADETVGAVTGAKTEEDEGEAMYWRFESWLKEKESLLGTTVGVVGELFAVRRDAWAPIPPDIAMDDLWTALDLAERGYAVRYTAAARSMEPSASGADQWERRTRNVAGVLHTIRRKSHLLRPERGLLALEILGHKLWRSTLGPLAHVALVVVALAAIPRSGLARLIVAVHAVGFGAMVASRRGRALPRPLSLLRQVLYLQAVGLAGLVRYLRRGIAPAWEKQAR